MVTRDDIKFKQQKLQFEAAIETAEDDYEVRDLAADFFPKVLEANIPNAQKAEELTKILDKIKEQAADKLGDDIEKGNYWQGVEITANNEGIINRILEPLIKLTPKGYDNTLTSLAKEIATNCDGGNRYMQYENPTCLHLMNMVYEKLNNKSDFKYLDIIAAYQQQAELQARQKAQNREDKRRSGREMANKRLEEIEKELKSPSTTSIDKLDLIDEALDLSSQKYFSPSTANSKRTGYCEQALAICRQELPWRKDLEIRYEGILKRYDVQRKHIKNRQIRNNKTVGVFTR